MIFPVHSLSWYVHAPKKKQMYIPNNLDRTMTYSKNKGYNVENGHGNSGCFHLKMVMFHG